MFAGEDFNGPARMDDSATRVNGTCLGQCKPHGTSMLAFVTGKYLGSSKNVEPWVVRVPRRRPGGGGSRPEDWLRGLALINQRITETTPSTQAVVCLSWSFPGGSLDIYGEDYEKRWVSRPATEINNLIDKGVFVVTGSGNSEIVSFGGFYTVAPWVSRSSSLAPNC